MCEKYSEPLWTAQPLLHLLNTQTSKPKSGPVVGGYGCDYTRPFSTPSGVLKYRESLTPIRLSLG